MIHDLTTQKGRNEYMKSLETQNSSKKIKTEENIYLNRLKEQYIKAQELWNGRLILKNCYEYDAMRLFCLDTQLISFNDIELMENEVNSSF